MFQTFDDIADPALVADRVASLRAELKKREVDGFLVPRADEHQGEYVPPHAERLSWLTGFSGSAGLAILLAEKAAIFVDGRYTLQVRTQTDTNIFTPRHSMDEPASRWLEENLSKGAKLAYDPWLHTIEEVTRFKAAAQKAGAELVAVESNPLDAVWSDQPAPPSSRAEPYPLAYAGETSTEKLKRIAGGMAADGVDAAIITMPDSIAWLFNIRGADVPHVPFALSFAMLHDDGQAELFIDESKLNDEVRAHLGNAVAVHSRENFAGALDKLGAAKATVLIDPQTCAAWIHNRLATAGADIKRGDDPCELPKACKNAAEVAAMRDVHVKDGRALTRFLGWLSGNAPKGGVDEITAVKKLEAFRAETGLLKDLSFDTISGAGAHGAIIHYRVTEATNRMLEPGELFLLDSGGQYLGGTTDVTRTIAIGTASAEQRDRFTRVLKGHIALATARFPEGTSGAQLDALARISLWNAGLNYDHGTGHGVGAYLSVHEGPQRISKVSHVALKPGMILSNEPGYYKAGAYGIRIENLMVVTQAAEIEGGDRPMLGFETITLAPIDLNCVERSLLTDEEAAWLNAYHARIRDTFVDGLDEETRAWLKDATRSI